MTVKARVAVALLLAAVRAGAQQPAPPTDAAPPPSPPPVAEPAPPQGPPTSGPPVWVNLKNGTSIKGRLVSSEVGRVAIIETEDGWELSISWDRIASIGAEAPTPAPAPAPDDRPRPEALGSRPYTGLRAGLRLGAGVPFGSIESGSDNEVSRVFGTNLTLQGDLGAQVSGPIFVGVYAGYALGRPGSDAAGACEKYTCSVYGLRLGAEFTATFEPTAPASAWLGYAVGWSGDEIDVERPEGKRQLAFGGVDFLQFSGGYDWKLGDHFIAGPFAAFNGGMYLYRVDALDGAGSGKTLDPSLKGFIVLGARMMLNP